MLLFLGHSCRLGCFLQRNCVVISGRCISFKVGDSATFKKKITPKDVEKFAELSGDKNPLHIDKCYIQSQTSFRSCVVHGAYLNSLVSKVIGTQLPGPGVVVVRQELNFPNPCYVGEEVEVIVRLTGLRKIITIDFTCKTNNGQVILYGNANLIQYPKLNKENNI